MGRKSHLYGIASLVQLGLVGLLHGQLGDQRGHGATIGRAIQICQLIHNRQHQRVNPEPGSWISEFMQECKRRVSEGFHTKQSAATAKDKELSKRRWPLICPLENYMTIAITLPSKGEALSGGIANAGGIPPINSLLPPPHSQPHT